MSLPVTRLAQPKADFRTLHSFSFGVLKGLTPRLTRTTAHIKAQFGFHVRSITDVSAETPSKVSFMDVCVCVCVCMYVLFTCPTAR